MSESAMWHHRYAPDSDGGTVRTLVQHNKKRPCALQIWQLVDFLFLPSPADKGPAHEELRKAGARPSEFSTTPLIVGWKAGAVSARRLEPRADPAHPPRHCTRLRAGVGAERRPQ